MKRLWLFIFLYSFFVAPNTAQMLGQKLRFNIPPKYEGMKGDVKSVKLFTSKGEKSSNDEIIRVDSPMLATEKEFNKLGQLEKEISLGFEGKDTLGVEIYKYNAEGTQKLCISKIHKTGTMRRTLTLDGVDKKEWTTSHDGANSLNNGTTELYINYDRRMDSLVNKKMNNILVQYYNYNGLVIRSITNIANGKLVAETKTSYNNDLNKTYTQSFDNGKKIVDTTFDYTLFDEKGNWIKAVLTTTFTNTTAIEITLWEREIEYRD